MPTMIPYDPRLVLGNIVHKDALNNLEEIAKEQNTVDEAESTLNSLISTRRSLGMTANELVNLGIDPKDITTKLETLNEEIITSAGNYAEAKIKGEGIMQPLRAKMIRVNASQESPLDYLKSQVKSLPLAADSVNMNVQYFSYDSNKQSAETFGSQISGFVAKQTKFLGVSEQVRVAAAAGKQANSQASTHELQGTLVLAVSCTHKNVNVLAPFVLNVDKAVKVWNATYPKSKFDPTNGQDIINIAKEDESADEKITLISGTTFGSTFVGMVHILNSTTTAASETLTKGAASLQAQMEAGAWYSAQSGGLGVEASFGRSVKSLLSTQNISSHVTMVCMGVIPSMVASQVKLGVEKFASFDPKTNMEAIASLQNSTTADLDSVKTSADAARTGGKMVGIRAAEVKAALSALSEIQDGENKILDINSMMTAFDDYLHKAAEGNSGVPINYYLKDITRQMIAEMWVAKYYPGKFLSVISDDSTTPPAAEQSNGNQTGANQPNGNQSTANQPTTNQPATN